MNTSHFSCLYIVAATDSVARGKVRWSPPPPLARALGEPTLLKRRDLRRCRGDTQLRFFAAIFHAGFARNTWYSRGRSASIVYQEFSKQIDMGKERASNTTLTPLIIPWRVEQPKFFSATKQTGCRTGPVNLLVM